MRSAINTLLVVFSLMVALLASVSAKASCAIGIEREGVSWDWSQYGNSPYVCANSCKSVLKDVSVCRPEGMRCSGDFITDGSACPDSDGMVAGGSYPDPDSGGGDNGGGDGDSDMPASFDAIEHAVKNNMDQYSDEQYMALSSLEAARWSVETFRKLEQMRTEHFADMDSSLNTIKVKTNSIESKMDSINTKVSNIAASTSSSATHLHQINQKIDGISSRDYSQTLSSINAEIGALQGTIRGELNGLKSTMNNNTSSINNTITGTGNNLTSAIYSSATMFGTNNDVKAAVEGLGSGISDIAKGVGDIKDGLSTGDYAHRAPEGEIDFGDMPLYQPSAIEELEAETKELEAQYDEKVKQFKNVFSLDESRLQTGEFNNHSTQFTIASGQTITGMSAVFPALVDVSHWIAAAILFVAIVAGVRQLGN
ncbi:hypothetical protein [Vibrio coralliilyticus]|uniref:hypothetical protein n=1 Tax=Vibrio coralliilyticus TaxID=190893 RepID=UPI0017D24DFA|nr:hypothetical protein [Vibrio coralliilyticus]NUW69798.1 hypothetical protein [Vibrio coralliilyticus]